MLIDNAYEVYEKIAENQYVTIWQGDIEENNRIA